MARDGEEEAAGNGQDKKELFKKPAKFKGDPLCLHRGAVEAGGKLLGGGLGISLQKLIAEGVARHRNDLGKDSQILRFSKLDQ